MACQCSTLPSVSISKHLHSAISKLGTEDRTLGCIINMGELGFSVFSEIGWLFRSGADQVSGIKQVSWDHCSVYLRKVCSSLIDLSLQDPSEWAALFDQPFSHYCNCRACPYSARDKGGRQVAIFRVWWSGTRASSQTSFSPHFVLALQTSRRKLLTALVNQKWLEYQYGKGFYTWIFIVWS